VVGEAKWRALVQEGSGDSQQWMPRTGSHLVYYNDLLIPASHSLPLDLITEVAGFDTQGVVQYSDNALAGWLAEVYQIAMADASLVARQRALREAKQHVTDRTLGGEAVRDLTFNSSGISIESYKLVLLPMWLTGYRYKGEYYSVIVNGQSGNVTGRVPRSGFQKVLAGLFGG
jgi:hypothetical protein